ncbi:MAG: hypothetical protein IKJ74_04935 [Clostridia bacterium]|nr:hypothetical protein [Clostridia bacterium]
MEWIYELLTELVLAVSGVVLTALGAYLGKALGRLWKEKLQNETLAGVAKITVSAVQMMYRELDGAQKLSHALSMAEEMLNEKGIRLPKEKIRIRLEAALAELKGAFDRV